MVSRLAVYFRKVDRIFVNFIFVNFEPFWSLTA